MLKVANMLKLRLIKLCRLKVVLRFFRQTGTGDLLQLQLKVNQIVLVKLSLYWASVC